MVSRSKTSFIRPLGGLAYRTRYWLGVVLLSAVLVPPIGPAAFGQAAQPDAVPPAGSSNAPPEKIEPQRPIGQAPDQGSLSDQLNKSNGVIAPDPGPDSDMTRRPPDRGTAKTPVIPPPGAPGGRSDITPK